MKKKAKVIAYVGGGGKTSSILEAAGKFNNDGKHVVIATTTHMGRPKFIPKGQKYLTENIEDAKEQLQEGKVIWYGKPISPEYEKFTIPTDEEWKGLLEFADVILTEADGSKRRPVKVPGSNEPVIPEGTDEIIVVMGMSGYGYPISEVCHRIPYVLDILQKKNPEEILTEEHCLTADDYANMIAEGYILPLAEQFPQCEIKVYLNQITTPELLSVAKKIEEQICRLTGKREIQYVNYTKALYAQKIQDVFN